MLQYNILQDIEIKIIYWKFAEIHYKLNIHRKLFRFLLDIPTMHCVAASRRENRTRRFWTTYYNRLVTTSGFCRRSKVQRGFHSTAKVKATKFSPLYPNDPRSSRAPQKSPAYQEHCYHSTILSQLTAHSSS